MYHVTELVYLSHFCDLIVFHSYLIFHANVNKALFLPEEFYITIASNDEYFESTT